MEWAGTSIWVLGCGNPLFGDDGFGPAVAEYLRSTHKVPDKALVLNVGTAVRNMLFDLALREKKPKRIVVVDAVDCGYKPGEVFELSLDDLPDKKIGDFSIHQLPSSNLLRELKELCQIEIVVIVCQISHIPEMVEPGLSEPVRDAVIPTGELILEKYLQQLY